MQKPKKTVVKSSSLPLRTIIASIMPLTDAPVISGLKLAAYSCTACTKSFAMNKMVAGDEENALDPFCPNCGSDEVAPVAGEFNPEEFDDTCAQMTCASCSTQLIMSAATAGKNYTGSIACVACGTLASFTKTASEDDFEDEVDAEGLTDDDDDDSDAEGLDGEDVDFVLEDDVEDEDAEGDGLDFSDEAGAGAEVEDEISLDDEDEEEASEDDILDPEPIDEGDANLDGLEDEQASGDAVDEEVEDEEDEEAPAEEASEDEEETDELDLIDAIESSMDKGASVTAKFFRAGDSIYAMANDVPVGVQHKANVIVSRRELFENDAYLKALANSIGTSGLRNTMEEFGFNNLKVQVSASKLMSLSDERVSAKAEILASEHTNSVAQEIKACLGIASMGINKNFYNTKAGNVLKDAFVAELTTAGVRNPGKLVDHVFATAGDLHNKALLERAFDLMEQPVEVRNGISTAIAGMQYNSGYVEDESEGEEDGDDVVSSLSNPVTAAPVSRASKVVANATPVSTTISNLTNKHGSFFPRFPS